MLSLINFKPTDLLLGRSVFGHMLIINFGLTSAKQSLFLLLYLNLSLDVIPRSEKWKMPLKLSTIVEVCIHQ